MTTRLMALCAGVLALSVSAASAADISMPVKGPAMIPAPAPIYSWSGLYIGGHGGGGWGTANWITNATIPNELVRTRPSGWLAGGQIGYRYEFSPSWLVGIEVSGAFASIEDSVRANIPVALAAQLPGGLRRTELRSLIAVTGQIGHSWGPWLIYAKGGWATGDVRREAINDPPGFSVTWTQQADGWTAGAGLEYLIHPRISIGAEYAFYSLDVGQITRLNSGGFPVTAGRFDFDIHTIVARINFRLGEL